MQRTREEYGGFLPLELYEKTEYYNLKQMQRYNSAKAAIVNVLGTIEVKKVYMPYYLCQNVCKSVEESGIRVEYYSINSKLLPPNLPDETNICIFVVNYFGIMDNAVEQYVASFSHATIIVDNSHSFFHQPIMTDNVYNVYSCRKFFGVPDGAYIIGKNIRDKEVITNFSSENALYLLQCLERGTNYCYRDKKAADKVLASNYSDMSVLSQKLLKTIEYKSVRDRRHNNFKLYQSAFGQYNKLSPELLSVPYVYPLNMGIDIKEQLVEEKIYVPTLWSHLLDGKYIGSLEAYLSEYTVFLPLDQRYNQEDICFIIETVNKILKKQNRRMVF